ncbi:hypothetical protein ACQY0O_005684 [Thecaphora frezii]
MKSLHPLVLPVRLLLLVGIALLATVAARSQKPRPLHRISHASDVRLEVIEQPQSVAALAQHARRGLTHARTPERRSPRSVVSTDALRLSLRAFSQDFHLHLQPNHELLHPDGATVNYYAYNESSGESYISRSETLRNDDVRAYHGVVVHPKHTDRRLEEDRAGLKRDIYTDNHWSIVGRAAILLLDDGSDSGTPRFEGSFDWLGNQHHIVSAKNYHTKRSAADPVVERRHLEADSPLVHRNSDIMTEREAFEAGVEMAQLSTAMGCSSDGLEYNNHSRLFTGPNDGDGGDDRVPFTAHSFFVKPTPPRFSRRDLFGGVGGWFGRSFSEEEEERQLIGRSEDSSRRYFYDFDYLTPSPGSFGRRQSTGNDIANGGNQTNSFEDSIGSTSGCPSSPRVVYVGIASDCTYTQRFEGEDRTRVEILNNMNSASNLYRSTFNVSLGVVQLDVRSSACPSTAPSDAPWNTGCTGNTIDDRLSAFSQWRGQQSANGVGLWHLMTTCNSGSEIGVAWLGTLCMVDASDSNGQYVSGTGVSSITSQQWQVMAHEMGHNFGAIHDCTTGCSLSSSFASQQGGAACCPLTTSTCDAGADHIMNPSSQPNINNFSQCSIGNICSMLGRGLDTSCVETPGRRTTLSIQQCGNGILEPGEECDAGPEGSSCCTAQCRLTSGAQCDPQTSPCCTSRCQFAPSTQVCRPALDARCDTAETCNGTSAECPTDQKKDDGVSCGDGLSCANGLCTSRDLQCRQASTSSMSFSQACPVSNSQGCSLSCQDPSSSNRCLILQQTFVDGTSCGNGGRCEDGKCKAGSWQDTFRGWYNNNLRIAIPITIVVGIVVMLLLWAILRCCFNICRRGNGYTKAAMTSNGPAVAAGSGRQLYDAPIGVAAPPPPARYSSTAPGRGRRSSRPPSQSQSQSQAHWVDPSMYNGGPPSSQPGGGGPYSQPSYPPPLNNRYDTYGGGRS